MATVREWLQELEISALKHAKNLHKEFVRYLMGYITWDEFCDECRRREAKFEEFVRTKK